MACQKIYKREDIKVEVTIQNPNPTSPFYCEKDVSMDKALHIYLQFYILDCVLFDTVNLEILAAKMFSISRIVDILANINFSSNFIVIVR